jgi:hypothetical protein
MLEFQRLQQVGTSEGPGFPGRDGAADGEFLGAGDDGADDRAAGEIAVVQDITTSAAVKDLQELG